MAAREQILADFQACTGNDDIEECICILEQHDWNLMEAVNSAMAGLDTPEQPPPSVGDFLTGPPPYAEAIGIGGFRPDLNDGFIQTTSYQPPQANLPDDAGGSAGPEASGPLRVHSSKSAEVPGPSRPSNSYASTSADAIPLRLLNFNIEFRDKNYPLIVPDNERVDKLKELLEAELTIPVYRQDLCGWVNKNDRKVEDHHILRDLKLPKENTLFLIVPECSGATAMPQNSKDKDNLNIVERLTQTFTLNIKYRDKDRIYKLNFPGSKTIQEVKGDVYSIIDVPVRHQLWSGWPEAAKDETMTLAGSGIKFPSHDLQVRSTITQPESKQKPEEDMEIEISDDDFEDANDNFGLEEFDQDVAIVKGPEPMMPENCADQTEALENFSREFGSRYGECHPVFYIGSLEDSLKDSLQCPARDRKLLAIYLHHDQSILSNVFCSQILCAEGIVSYLSSNFITWAWDLTHETNRARLLSMCTRHFGSVATNTIRNFKPDELPLLLVISRNRATNEVVNVIHGNVTLDELMSNLLSANEVFREQLVGEIREESERNARETVKREQEEAYLESLLADKAKAEVKKREEDEKRKIEVEEQRVKDEEAAKVAKEEQVKETLRRKLEDQLPDEPPADCTEPISTIRFRCPGGVNLNRKFLAQNPLQILLNYVASKGFHIEDYKVLTTFPRRDLTAVDASMTLEQLKMFPQETVTLEEK